MNTELKLYVEHKTPGGWKWVPLPDVMEPDWELEINLIGLLSGLTCNLEPIAKKRGLPPDCDSVTREKAKGKITSDDDDEKEYYEENYDHSWLTLKEIYDYPWDRPHFICYDEKDYEEGMKKGKGDKKYLSRYFDQSPEQVQLKGTRPIVPEKEYLAQRDAGLWSKGSNSYVQIQVGTYRDAASTLLETIVPAIQGLGSPEDVRLIYWFKEA